MKLSALELLLVVLAVDQSSHRKLVDSIDGQLLWAARHLVDTRQLVDSID